MTSPLQSLVASGTKVWLDGVDPDLIDEFSALGITGATSNPKIIADLIETGRFDDQISQALERFDDDEQVAWHMTDHFVSQAQEVFRPVWDQTAGNDGYVSFELDPLLEDPELGPSHDERVSRYIELAQQWSKGQKNRMIKVPATAAGLDALEEVAAAGVTINVTLCFTQRQYEIARDAIWRGRQRAGKGGDLDQFKSVYSIFVSRIDVYTQKHLPDLSDQTQGIVGIYNAKHIWKLNEEFWKDKGLKLQQELIFASTGVKLKGDAPDKYVAAFAGSGIETNPPKTNAQVQEMGKTYSRQVDRMPPEAVIREIQEKVDFDAMEATLMEEGVAKFADPHKQLLEAIGRKRKQLTAAG